MEIHCLTSLTGGAMFVDDILRKTGELIGAKVFEESGRRRGLEKERGKDSKEELFVGTYIVTVDHRLCLQIYCYSLKIITLNVDMRML